MHVVVAEVLQEPESPCGPHPSDIFIEHDRSIEVHPAKFQDVFDGPHECLQRFRCCIIQAETEQVKMRRPGNPALLYECVDRAHIDDAQIRVAEACGQLRRRPEQIWIAITLIDHVACSPPFLSSSSITALLPKEEKTTDLDPLLPSVESACPASYMSGLLHLLLTLHFTKTNPRATSGVPTAVQSVQAAPASNPPAAVSRPSLPASRRQA